MSTLGDIASHGAPVLVAVVAIGVSSWQQSKSRRFDRRERSTDRAHDREMRANAERHERRLSDLDYQRRLLDDVANAMEAAKEAIFMLGLSLDLDDADDDQRQDAIASAGNARDELRVQRVRMVLRFGAEHDAVKLIEQTLDAVGRGWLIAVAHERHPVRDTEKAMLDVRRETAEAVRSVSQFLALAGDVVGAAPERD